MGIFYFRKHSQILSGSGQQGMNNKCQKGPCKFRTPRMEPGRARRMRVSALVFDSCWTMRPASPKITPQAAAAAWSSYSSCQSGFLRGEPDLQTPYSTQHVVCHLWRITTMSIFLQLHVGYPLLRATLDEGRARLVPDTRWTRREFPSSLLTETVVTLWSLKTAWTLLCVLAPLFSRHPHLFTRLIFLPQRELFAIRSWVLFLSQPPAHLTVLVRSFQNMLKE